MELSDIRLRCFFLIGNTVLFFFFGLKEMEDLETGRMPFSNFLYTHTFQDIFVYRESDLLDLGDAH